MKSPHIPILVCMLLLYPTTAKSQELSWKWTKTDTLFQAVDTALWVLDWGQTRDIAKKPDRHRESNPILGDHPTTGEVDRYFVIGTAVKTGIAIALPNPYRRWWQCMWIGISISNVHRNYSIGLRLRF